MSQQINLLLPELRPRFDWLALPVVAGAAMAVLVLIVALSSLAALKSRDLQSRDSEQAARLTAAQQQIQVLGQALGARQADARLPAEIEAMRLAVTQRQEVMAVINQGAVGQNGGFSGLLQGFSRQMVDGVWLVAFTFAGKNIEIRGRLSDPALLPKYIKHLNDEPAFAGRRFAALDMKGVDPANDKPDAAQVANKAVVSAPYTEFALRTEQLSAAEPSR